MKKQIGDRIETVSIFGYKHTGTVTGILEETPFGNAYEVEFDAGSEKVEGEWEPVDNNLYLPKQSGKSNVSFVRLIPPEGIYN